MQGGFTIWKLIRVVRKITGPYQWKAVWQISTFTDDKNPQKNRNQGGIASILKSIYPKKLQLTSVNAERLTAFPLGLKTK